MGMLENSPIQDAIEQVNRDVGTYGIARMVATALKEERDIDAIPMYSSVATQTAAYAMGDRRTLLAVVDHLEVIDEDRLSWKQVVEVRQDLENVAKLRAFRHWIDSNFEGKPINFIVDAIGVRYDSYQRALRKHGIKTVLGSMQSLLDPKFIGAATLVGGTIGLGFGALAGVGSVAIPIVGKTVLSVAENLLNLSETVDRQGAEVAFIYEVGGKRY